MSTTNTDLRERAVLPILIPLLAIVATEVIVFSMSRVLLTAGKQGAVLVALGVALAILVGASFIAARPRMSGRAITGLLTVLLIGAVAAGAYANQRGPFYLREEAANRPKIEVTAKNLAFSVKTLELSPAGAIVNFHNADTQPHNIAIYPSEVALDKALFKGEIVPAGGQAAYDVPKMDPGEYYFHCDVHPTMSGKAIVEQGAGSAAHAGAHEG
jgi:plastocyanin